MPFHSLRAAFAPGQRSIVAFVAGWRLIAIFVMVAAVTSPVAFAMPAPAFAAPSAAQVASSRDRVEQAARRLESARKRQDLIGRKLAKASKRLDAIVAEQDEAQSRLSERAQAMYRSGDVTFVSVLMGAESFDEFASRWQLLTRMNAADAEAIESLELSRVKARKTSSELLRLQEESVRSADKIARELRVARKEFAANEAALREYQRRVEEQSAARVRLVAAKAKTKAKTAEPAEPAAPESDDRQELQGSGAWKTAKASHYGRTFKGRGASGKKIGPYSMMCAHKTLPFGTLIEFEYDGKRAVASVEDRGPHTPGRSFDLGPGVVRVLDFEGVHEVRWRVIER